MSLFFSFFFFSSLAHFGSGKTQSSYDYFVNGRRIWWEEVDNSSVAFLFLRRRWKEDFYSNTFANYFVDLARISFLLLLWLQSVHLSAPFTYPSPSFDFHTSEYSPLTPYQSPQNSPRLACSRKTSASFPEGGQIEKVPLVEDPGKSHPPRPHPEASPSSARSSATATPDHSPSHARRTSGLSFSPIPAVLSSPVRTRMIELEHQLQFERFVCLFFCFSLHRSMFTLRFLQRHYLNRTILQLKESTKSSLLARQIESSEREVAAMKQLHSHLLQQSVLSHQQITQLKVLLCSRFSVASY